MFAFLMLSNRRYFSPTHLLQKLPSYFIQGQQQDVSEYCKFLFDQLEGEFKANGFTEKKQMLNNLFEGKLISIITCKRCNKSTSVFETFLELSLSFSDNNSLNDLSQMINFFLTKETLTGSNQFHCENCLMLTDAERVKQNLTFLFAFQILIFFGGSQILVFSLCENSFAPHDHSQAIRLRCQI